MTKTQPDRQWHAESFLLQQATRIRDIKRCIDRVARVAPVLYFVDTKSRYTLRFVRLMKARNRRVRVLARQRWKVVAELERIKSYGWDHDERKAGA